MKITADLHIHSPYSRATSPRLRVPYLDRWARIKGIGLMGSGDCTHPLWLSELRENLDDAEPGLFTFKNKLRAAFDSGPALAEELPQPQFHNAPPQLHNAPPQLHNAPPNSTGVDKNEAVRFILTGEISTIYSRGGKTRKVHHVVLLPGFKAAALFNTKLERIGNIRSDGRPILGLDSRDLFAMLLDADDRSLLIPAHIWTPWFSALGAKSGFDSIEECYGDLSSRIPAVETGLSSDPPMNWALSSLDSYSIISNSDAHSPDKLGREATIFDMELSYEGLASAIFPYKHTDKQVQQGGIIATVEFFPEEGKYHYDGHRKCGICITPDNAAALSSGAGSGWDIQCPVCGKALTRGVMGRVMELADRPLSHAAPDMQKLSSDRQGNRRPFYSLIPLKEILGELLGTGPASKKVNAAYCSLIKNSSELELLMDMDLGSINRINTSGISGELLAQAIERMRNGQVSITAGYDGEYGVIRVFPPDNEQRPVLNSIPVAHRHESQALPSAHCAQPAAAPSLSPEQQAIINHDGKHALIIAGPGTGKTAVLAARIAKLIDLGTGPAAILALSFTVKAAGELRERVSSMSSSNTHTATFHSFCCSVLREEAARYEHGAAHYETEAAGIPSHFEIIGEERRSEILAELCGKKMKPGSLGRYIEKRKQYLLLPGEDSPTAFAKMQRITGLIEAAQIPERIPEMDALYAGYRKRLNESGLLDYDDLIAGTARLFAVRPEILAEYCRRYSHIFVDEYQDLNLSQYIILRLLADHGPDAAQPSLWVIGDPNQAIYGFRGSDKRFIDRFMLDFPDARRFELSRSFRCAQPIISAAAQLTDAAGQQCRESSMTGTARPVELRRTAYASDKAEAEGIARAISRLTGGTSFFAKDSFAVQDSRAILNSAARAYTDYEDTAAPGDCAILIRAAPLAEPIITALKNHGIPYNFCGEVPWWEEEPFRSFLLTVRASKTPEEEFKKGKHDAKLMRVMELAEMAGGIIPLLDAFAFSDSGGISEYRSEGVHLMTIHAAKGLEFDHVFVPACEDNILPFTLFGECTPEQREEELRLLYVAMTRARIGLSLSWAHKRIFKGRLLQGTMSPFLNQLEQIIPLATEKKTRKKNEQLSLF